MQNRCHLFWSKVKEVGQEDIGMQCLDVVRGKSGCREILQVERHDYVRAGSNGGGKYVAIFLMTGQQGNDALVIGYLSLAEMAPNCIKQPIRLLYRGRFLTG
jgi:hypothetical protein